MADGTPETAEAGPPISRHGADRNRGSDGTIHRAKVAALLRAKGRVKRVDSLSPEERSKRMALVRGKDTRPEMLVRRLVFNLGYRYRLHARDLPGRPDLVFRKKQKAIFVHGCFWHRHRAASCALARLPKSKLDFWRPKLEGNRKRDERNKRALARAGWKVLTLWECEIKDLKWLGAVIKSFLDA